MKQNLIGLAMGFAVGLVDCFLFSLTGEALPFVLVATAVTFWTTVGWAVHVAPINLSPIIRGLIVSWAMNAPWYIEYVLLQGQSEMALPMLGLATVFGALLGLSSGVAHKMQLASKTITSA